MSTDTNQLASSRDEGRVNVNKSLLIWGGVCLGLAGALVVLNFILPPESLTFMIGNTNLPWFLPIILACVGFCILLIASIGTNRKATNPSIAGDFVQDPKSAALNRRLESIGWALFLIMLGGFSLIPQDQVPKGIWSLGIGLIMLGLNAARYFYKIRMSGFTTFLGILSLLGGIAELIGLTSLQGALLLILLGALLILRPWFDKRQLFGKAEQSRA